MARSVAEIEADLDRLEREVGDRPTLQQEQEIEHLYEELMWARERRGW